MPGLSRLTLFSLLVTNWLVIFPLLPLTVVYARRIDDAAARSFSSAKVIPPVAKKVRHEMKMFDDVRMDNYYWLHDDSHSNPEILSYLKAENDYTNQSMSSVKQFEDQLYAEIRTRIKEDNISTPIRRGSYYYYERTLEGKEYALHCRRFITNDTSYSSVYDVMPTGPEAPVEHVILDENIKAQAHEYYHIAAFRPSPNNKLIAYAEDTKGDYIYNIYVIDADKGTVIGNPLKGVSSNIEWAGDDALVYTTTDETFRANKVWSHKLLSEQSSDLCLYHEKDDMLSLYVQASESKQYLFVVSYSSKSTEFILYLDLYKQEDGLMTLTPRTYGIETSASHRGNHFFIQRTSDELFNSELVYCPIDNISDTHILIPHRERVKIQYFRLFSGHIVIYERENGLKKATVYSLPQIGQDIGPLQNGRAIDFVDPIYSVYAEESQFSSSILRFSYSSMKTPPSVYDYDMTSGISVLKKIKLVLGGFESSDYLTERKWAVSTDGTKVPISILYKKNLVKLDGSDPLLLCGYGAYGRSMEPRFDASLFSLVDRGFIYAIAHVRGGGEMGGKWYEDGKLLKKRNTFADFIACAEYLIENKYGSKEKLCISGSGAGGLLIGSVLNMRPNLFKAAVVGVPLLDVVTSLLDPTIPRTTWDWEELGDPRKEEYYYYMKSYSPVDNVIAQNYPNILVTIALNDRSGRMYFESAKFVAKLRATKTDDNILLFKCDLGKSGIVENMQEEAFTYAFIMKALDMAPPVSP